MNPSSNIPTCWSQLLGRLPLRKSQTRAWQRSALLMSVLLCTLDAGATSAQQEPSAQQEAPSAQPPAATLVIPEVSLEGLEPEIAAQLQLLREHTAEALNGDDKANSAEATATLARHYHAYEFYAAAAAAYQASLELQLDETSAYLLALVLREQGDLEEALRLFSIIASRQPKYLAARYYQALTLFDLGRFDSSRATVPEGTESPAFLVLLGRLAMQVQEPEIAIHYYESAIEKAPEANRTYYLLAQAHRAAGDADQAAAALGRYGPVGVKPSDPLMDGIRQLRTGSMPFALSGRTAFRAGRYAEAAELFRKALAARPDDAGLMVNLATAVAQDGSTEEPIELLMRAVEIEPNSSAALFNLGVLLTRVGRFDESVVRLSAALEAVPNDVAVRAALAEALAKTGERGLALEHLTQLHTDAVFGEGLRLLELQLLVSEGQFDLALTRLESALEALPSSGLIAHAAARFFASSPSLEHRDGPRALELASLVFEATGKAADAITVALAHGELGQCEQAAQWMEMAAKELASSNGSLTASQRGFRDAAEEGSACRPLD